MSETRVMDCPREGCANGLHLPEMIVCTGDFQALAGMCRAKKRLGQPEADMIEGRGGGAAYRCILCRQYHNGSPARNRMDLVTVARATLRALEADPRVGRKGILNLADAWVPSVILSRSRWYEGLDQSEAFDLPWS
jgi:hypothetical protein